MLGEYSSTLGKMVYLKHQSFLPASDALRSTNSGYPNHREKLENPVMKTTDTTGYSLLENYNNSVEKVLTLMTLYLKIVLNTDVFQHAILSSCWNFWRV